MLVQSRGLRDKYCIVGVGETEYSRASGRTTRAMAVEAIRKAILDAGLKAADVDGMLDYQGGDSTLANSVASDLGIRFNFYMDVMGGGSSTSGRQRRSMRRRSAAAGSARRRREASRRSRTTVTVGSSANWALR